MEQTTTINELDDGEGRRRPRFHSNPNIRPLRLSTASSPPSSTSSTTWLVSSSSRSSLPTRFIISSFLSSSSSTSTSSSPSSWPLLLYVATMALLVVALLAPTCSAYWPTLQGNSARQGRLSYPYIKTPPTANSFRKWSANLSSPDYLDLDLPPYTFGYSISPPSRFPFPFPSSSSFFFIFFYCKY